jgi:hypothetical protein
LLLAGCQLEASDDSFVAVLGYSALGMTRCHPRNALLRVGDDIGNLLVEMPSIRTGSSVGLENVCSPSRPSGN